LPFVPVVKPKRITLFLVFDIISTSEHPPQSEETPNVDPSALLVLYPAGIPFVYLLLFFYCSCSLQVNFFLFLPKGFFAAHLPQNRFFLPEI
jgi:hypothetical protein